MRKGKIRALAIVLAIGMIFTLMPNVSVTKTSHTDTVC